MTTEQFLAQSIAALEAKVQLTWVDNYDLLERHGIEGVVPWILARGNDYGHTHIVTTRAVQAGLTLRPVADTVRDTLSWFSTLPSERRAAAKWMLPEAKEQAVLAEWKARR
jgi:2'-hydroxyisoflavone reductase